VGQVVLHVQGLSESEAVLFSLGPDIHQERMPEELRTVGATGSSGELIAWTSQTTSRSRHKPLCKPGFATKVPCSHTLFAAKEFVHKSALSREIRIAAKDAQAYSLRGIRSGLKPESSRDLRSLAAKEALPKIACHIFSVRSADRLVKADRPKV